MESYHMCLFCVYLFHSKLLLRFTHVSAGSVVHLFSLLYIPLEKLCQFIYLVDSFLSQYYCCGYLCSCLLVNIMMTFGGGYIPTVWLLGYMRCIFSALVESVNFPKWVLKIYMPGNNVSCFPSQNFLINTWYCQNV